MNILQFKTDIKCSGCLAKVTPHLEAIPGIEKWEVAIQNPDKILTVEADTVTAGEVKKAVAEAGFQATEI